MNKKISELPKKPYTDYALDAQKRGIELTEGAVSDAVSVMLIGALDMIRELIERLEKLEKQ